MKGKVPIQPPLSWDCCIAPSRPRPHPHPGPFPVPSSKGFKDELRPTPCNVGYHLFCRAVGGRNASKYCTLAASWQRRKRSVAHLIFIDRETHTAWSLKTIVVEALDSTYDHDAITQRRAVPKSLLLVFCRAGSKSRGVGILLLVRPRTIFTYTY